MIQNTKIFKITLSYAIFILLFLPSLLYAEAKIEFGSKEFSFGSMQREGIQKKLPHIFTIKNTGTAPLEITSAKSG